MAPGRRIVLTTFGSLGDLHPFLAIAHELQARGHRPVVATSPSYRARVEGQGLEYFALRPDDTELLSDPSYMRRIMDKHTGLRYLVGELIMPAIRDTYADTSTIADGADLLVSHPLTFATRLVAEKRGLPWASSMLAPLGFFSVDDPSILAPAPWLVKLRKFGRWPYQGALSLIQRSVRKLGNPWRELRRELGLPPTQDDPLFAAQHSPHLVLALFSRVLGEAQADWPAHTRITGFPFYDHGSVGLPPGLPEFLRAGPPPVVFTLGSAAVMDAGTFFGESVEAVRRTGRRAVLLIGSDPRNKLPSLPEGVAAFEYASYTDLFPQAAAIVHQGGVGTTAQALRAGRPMLIMPFALDQPDNAARIIRLGVGRMISRRDYQAAKVAQALEQLLQDPACQRRAEEVGRLVAAEHGVAHACDALESLLR